MLDYDIVRAFRPIIIQGLQDLGITAKVLMNYQPTKQGKNNNTVYFFNIGDKNIGSVERLDYWDNDTQKMMFTERQVIETTFQVNTIVKQDPSNLVYTAKDLCRFVNTILQSSKTINDLQSQGLGILRIGEIRNVPYMDSDDNYSYNPSFDFIVSHSHTVTGEVMKIDNFNHNIKRI